MKHETLFKSRCLILKNLAVTMNVTHIKFFKNTCYSLLKYKKLIFIFYKIMLIYIMS